jgi:cation transport ATPase
VDKEDADQLAALERAETRLDAHARQRSRWRARRAQWRTIRAWVLALLILPAAGAAGFVAVLQAAGHDLRSWSSAAAAALIAVALIGPAALSGWFARAPGRYQALALSLCTGLMEIRLVFGVAFLALGYGPR